MYVLQNKVNNSFYVGYSADLKQRFIEHNTSKSGYTAKYKPWILLYYESYMDKSLALKREQNLKKFKSAYYNLIKRIVSNHKAL